MGCKPFCFSVGQSGKIHDWGMFPDFYPKENISFEGHMGGFVAGIVLAIYFRKKGPQPKQYSWELEEEIEEDDDAYWKLKNTNNT